MKIIKNIFGEIAYFATSSIPTTTKFISEKSKTYRTKLEILCAKDADLIGTGDLRLITKNKQFQAEILDFLVVVFSEFWRHDQINHNLLSLNQYKSITINYLNQNNYQFNDALVSYYLIYYSDIIYDFLKNETLSWQQFNFYNEQDLHEFKSRFKRQIIDEQLLLLFNLKVENYE